MPTPAKRRSPRRARRTTATLGVALTLLIIALDWLGWLAPLERWCFDERVAWCQQFVPPPTPHLLHVDITDEALERIGRWPWERWKLARIIDELRLAGAKVIALDLLFTERQTAAKVGLPGGEDPGFDAELAAAIKRHGNVIIAIDPTLPEPINIIRNAAADVGLVTYPQAPDGVSRFISLRGNKDRQQYTHLALVLATRQLDSTPHAIIEGRHELRCNTPGGPITIPVHHLPALPTKSQQYLYADMYIPWFGAAGSAGWETMLDWPKHRDPTVGRLSVFDVWNAASDDPAMLATARRFHEKFPGTADPPALPDRPTREQREAFIRTWLGRVNEMLGYYHGEQLTPPMRDEVQLLADCRATFQQLLDNLDYIDEQRASLRAKINGKAVILGYTVTGLLDQMPTPLHPTAPGVTVHGAVFNGILTGEMWRDLPWGYTAAITLLLGVATTAITTWRGPLLATLSAAGLAGAYVLVNGYLLFDAGNLIVGVAGPVTAVIVVWAGCTVARFVTERLERTRVERRFRSYVDPMLVDYVLEHPEKTRLDGEIRELTVVFTDLKGFTELSEKLGEKVVPVLSEYFELMVPIIRENNGYVNKFLGDGMMFFYGAPRETQGHAIHAVSAVLRMQETLLEFNELLARRGLPLLGMRAGIATGSVTVGDAGPADASDYTVLGDDVNFAARLESANKATDTQVLINNRAAELVSAHFLLRPIGNIQVVGKTEGVFVYEPLCRMAEADDERKQLVDDTLEVINAFVAARFTDCLASLDAFEAKYGRDKLTTLYREYCGQFIKEPPGDTFTGRIVLTEK